MTEFAGPQRDAGLAPRRAQPSPRTRDGERAPTVASAVLALQRSAGNRATTSVLARRVLAREKIAGGMWAASWTDEDGSHEGTMQIVPWRNLNGGNNNWIHLT